MYKMANPELVKDEELLKADDIARLLNISKPMAYRLMQRGEIAVIRINTAVRVKPSDLQAYIERSRTGSIAG
jgi:excisionase family DNA binding protein